MSQQTSQPARQQDRRKSPRLPVRGRLLACLVESDRPLRIREIGFGGFATETVEPLPLSVMHQVQFTAQDDKSAVLRAQSLHSWPSCLSDGTPCFVTGFAFVPDRPAEDQQTVKMLIETVTATGLYSDD
jgi:hypothetical protein